MLWFASFRLRALTSSLLCTALFPAFGLLACGNKEEARPAPVVEEQVAEPVEEQPVVPSGPPYKIFAKRWVVAIHDRPARDAQRIGYLRAGAIQQAKTRAPVSREGCGAAGEAEGTGWYELETGGFVCTGRVAVTFEGRRPPERQAAQPDLEAALPYQYGRNRRNNAPVFRRLPTDEEAAELEGYRIPGEDGGVPTEGATEGAAVATAEASGGQAAAMVAAPSVTSLGAASVEAAEEGEPARTTLGSLRGERGGLLIRRMMPGFIVSLDRDFRVGARRYWRSLNHGFIPYSALGMVESRTSFQGREIPSAETEVAFIASNRVNFFGRGRDDKPRRRGPATFHESFVVTSHETHDGVEYLVAENGRIYRREDVRLIERITQIPEGVAADSKWLDIDLTHQTLVAYEGLRPVYATLISSGRIRQPGDPDRDFRTPVGVFRIKSKHVADTMQADTVADGPYSIEDVPYVMYFHEAYALHSAFWHDGFGRPRSHGCVNLAPLDARWVFQWSTPTMPNRWHSVYPHAGNEGTFVAVRGQTPEG